MSRAASQILEDALVADLRRQYPDREPFKRSYCYASEYHECAKHLYLRLTEPQRLPSVDDGSRANFRRGEATEDDLRVWLDRAGSKSNPKFSIQGTQERIEIRGRDGQVALVGKKDMSIVIDGEEYPAEIKDWRTMHSRVNSVSDMLAGRWTRKAPFQILAYLYGKGLPVGFLVLNTPGLPKIIEVRLEDHLTLMEEFLANAEAAAGAAREGSIPPPGIDEFKTCMECEFIHNGCEPTLLIETGMGTLDAMPDPSVLEALDTMSETEDAAKEFEKAKKKVRDAFHGISGNISMGGWLIKGEMKKRTTYNVPAEVKAKFKEAGSAWYMTIEKVDD